MAASDRTDLEALQARAEAQAKADRAAARTFPNLVWSLVACAVVIGFIALVTWRPRDEEVRAIDYSRELAEARRVAPYRVLAPNPLPTDWHATSVEILAPDRGPITWHLGVLTADRRYIGLEQSNGDSGRFLSAEIGPSRPDGTSTIGSTTWHRKFLPDREERALVHTGPGVTTIITGTPDYGTLEAFAKSLS